MELQRNSDLAGVRQDYIFGASKRFLTQKKREQLRQKLVQEQARINAKYDSLIQENKENQQQNRGKLKEYQQRLKVAIEEDPKVLEIKGKLFRIQTKLNSIEGRLGYQARTSDYTDHGKNRVSL